MRTQFGEQLRYQDRVTVGPRALPVHRDAVKLHVRLGTDVSAEDAAIDTYIREATEAVEQDSGRALVMQTVVTYLDQFPMPTGNQVGMAAVPFNNIEVRHCPVYSFDSLTYTDYNGTVQTWSLSSNAQYNTTDEPATLRYKWGGMWPVARQQEKSITVTTHNGYAVPFTASGNVLTVAGYTPTNGDTWRVSNSGGSLPTGLSTMTDYYVISASGQTCSLSLTSNGSAVTLSTAGSGNNYLGEIPSLAIMALYLRIAMSYGDREGAEYEQCKAGYWSKIYSLRYEGV